MKITGCKWFLRCIHNFKMALRWCAFSNCTLSIKTISQTLEWCFSIRSIVRNSFIINSIFKMCSIATIFQFICILLNILTTWCHSSWCCSSIISGSSSRTPIQCILHLAHLSKYQTSCFVTKAENHHLCRRIKVWTVISILSNTVRQILHQVS